MPPTFYDIHCHAMNLSHPNLLAFIKGIGWRVAGMISIPGLNSLIALLCNKYLSRSLNLLSVMENDIANFFLIIEYYLKAAGTVENDRITIGGNSYETILLTPLLIDFGYKNIKTDTFYRIPSQKPIVEQTIDVFNGIKKYREYELIKKGEDDFEIEKRNSRTIFEIYPFMGINTRNYEEEKMVIMLDKYFGDYTGSRDELRKNMGRFDGNIDAMKSNFFSGIKFYPPIGFDPWPENDSSELSKLKRLYEYCCEKNIPLTAHCSDGGFVFDENKSDMFTSPERWEMALQAYPQLKLDIAHFGKQDKKRFLFMPRSDWQKKIIELINNYPHVYTDFSCLAFDIEYYKSLRDLIESQPQKQKEKLLQRILFGSDFMINLLWSDSYNDYLETFIKADSTVLKPEQKHLFCSTNPERFLFGK
jgi:hypothetical protein